MQKQSFSYVYPARKRHESKPVMLHLFFLSLVFLAGLFFAFGCNLFSFSPFSSTMEMNRSLEPIVLTMENLPEKKMLYIPADGFLMGSEKDRPDEKPVREKSVEAFFMDDTPLSYRQFYEYIKEGGKKTRYWLYKSYNQAEHPVTGISWNEAACYCNWKSIRYGLEPTYKFSGHYDQWGNPIWKLENTKNGFRLPSETQFEYAARAGLKGKDYPWGDAFFSEWANFDTGRGFKSKVWWRLAPVYSQKKNGWGLYGMSGNIWEWSNSCYSPYADKDKEKTNKASPHKFPTYLKALRGGSWGSLYKEDLRVFRRSFNTVGNYNYDIGLRTILPVKTILALIKKYPDRFKLSKTKEKDKGSSRKRIIWQLPQQKRLSNWFARNCKEQLKPRLPDHLNPNLMHDKKDVSKDKGIIKKKLSAENRGIEQRLQTAYYGEEFIRLLARYLRQNYPESIYFQLQVDKQKRMTPLEFARLIVTMSKKTGVNPVFLTGIMASESGLGTVSFPRWFNNPMAYHWANWKMRYGAPSYNPKKGINRKFHHLKQAIYFYGRGIRTKVYYEAAKKDFYAFHYVYVGYEALEWMGKLAKVYRELLGLEIKARNPGRDIGRYIYLDWDMVKSSYQRFRK